MEPIKLAPNGKWRGWATCLALAFSLSVLAAGCGEMNDNPADSGLTVQVMFPADSGSTTQLTSPTEGDPVLSLIVGALVITFRSTPITPDEIATIDDATRQDLEDDAIQSALYFEITQLPTSSNTVSFRIPPEGSGNWQLVAIGTRDRINTLDDIKDNSPIWYGFSETFLGGPDATGPTVHPGDTAPPLVMQPGCGLDSPPDPAGDGTGLCP